MFTFKVDEIVNRIYIANFAAANNLQLMKDYGFTHVIVSATELPTPFPKSFTYLKIDVQDSLTDNIRRYFDQCLEFMNQALQDKDSIILVHCMQGISRSPTIVIAYLMKYKRLSLARALEIVSSRRPEIKPNPGFMKQLEDYDNELRAEKRTTDGLHSGCLCMLL